MKPRILLTGIVTAFLLSTASSQALAGISVSIGSSCGPSFRHHGKHHRWGHHFWDVRPHAQYRRGPYVPRYRHRPRRHYRWHHPVVVYPPYQQDVSAPNCALRLSKVTLWITNSNGSQTEVKLRRSGPGYLGPRGEYYPTRPTNEQLRVVYRF